MISSSADQLHSPDTLDAILPEDLIGRDNRTILLERLGGKQAVEWVTVVEWQRRNPRRGARAC
jgi:hypothetical protein